MLYEGQQEDRCVEANRHIAASISNTPKTKHCEWLH
jgi:hypothetical protein